MKTLVVYFSFEGNTKLVAEKISETIKGLTYGFAIKAFRNILNKSVGEKLI